MKINQGKIISGTTSAGYIEKQIFYILVQCDSGNIYSAVLDWSGGFPEFISFALCFQTSYFMVCSHTVLGQDLIRCHKLNCIQNGQYVNPSSARQEVLLMNR